MWLFDWLRAYMDEHPGTVAASLTALGAAASRAADWAWKRWTEYRATDEQRRGEALAEIQRLLQRIPDDTAAVRAMLVTARSEHPLSEPGSIYITVHSEAKAPGVAPILELWQRRTAELSYRSLIVAPLLSNEAPVLVIDVAGAPPGDLRDQWLVSDVRACTVVRLHVSTTELWYLAVHHAVPAALILGEDSEQAGENTVRGRWVVATTASQLTALIQKALP